MSALSLERYQPGNSPLHRLDPRVKAVMVFALVVGIVVTPERALPVYPLLWALPASMAAVGRLGVMRVGRTALVALPFALAAATLLFTTRGQPVASIGSLTVTDAGLVRFAAIVVKSWLALQCALLLSMTTPFSDLLWALGSLRVPAALLAILGFMYRYLLTLQDEAQRLARARLARSATTTGHPSGGRLPWRARAAGGMVGNLFLRSYERSERVYAAMQARGYRGEIKRLAPPPLRWREAAWAAIPVAALVVIELVAVVWWGN